MQKKAVILFNLGGPDCLDAVRPFLFNLFRDKAIIRLPAFFRLPLAWWIAYKRTPKAQAIYAQLGGKSPILENTQAQAQALETQLNHSYPESNWRVFIAMRYWKPFTEETIRLTKEYNPDHVILLPLYPQFSTTTTASSFDCWKKESAKAGLKAPVQSVCCYPALEHFIQAQVELITPHLRAAQAHGKTRLLFSAHGLPERIVKAGDPYAWQVETSVAAIISRLNIPGLDYTICYQSRVGRLKWIGPSAEEEIYRAGKDGVCIVLVPIAFVSEHSETLVELDRDYANLSRQSGVASYHRVETVSAHPLFIEGLAALCQTATSKTTSSTGNRLCPREFGNCACVIPAS